jgi:hypothetical protein
MKEDTKDTPVVFVVDDDASVREGLDSLFRSIDVQVETFAALLLQHLLRKPQPFMVLDTHAGAGFYDLTTDEAEKTGEALDGIGRVIGKDVPTAAAYPAGSTDETLHQFSLLKKGREWPPLVLMKEKRPALPGVRLFRPIAKGGRIRTERLADPRSYAQGHEQPRSNCSIAHEIVWRPADRRGPFRRPVRRPGRIYLSHQSLQVK